MTTIELLQEVLAHIVAAENEPSSEAQKRAIDFIRDNHLPFMTAMPCPDEKIIGEPEKYIPCWKRVYEKVWETMNELILEKVKVDAWYMMHPVRELTKEEQKEIAACERTIFMYDVIDRPTGSDETLRRSAEKAKERIQEIKNEYRGGVKIL